MKKVVLFCIICVLLVIVLVSCSEEKISANKLEKYIVGVWGNTGSRSRDLQFFSSKEFRDLGSGVIPDLTGVYSVTGNTVTVTTNSGKLYTFVYDEETRLLRKNNGVTYVKLSSN